MHELLKNTDASTSRNELVIFLLDGSGSMRDFSVTSNNTSPSKSIVLNNIVKGVLERISESHSANLFRIAIIRFGLTSKVETFQKCNYFNVNNAINLLKPSISDFDERECTDIAIAFDHATQIVNEFLEDDDMSPRKDCTLILCTDGKHFEHETDLNKKLEELQRFINAAMAFSSTSISPNIACVSLGSDADMDALIEISTVPNLDQQRRFDKANLLKEIKKDTSGQYRLCLAGHDNDEIGKDKIETIRGFLIIGTASEV